MVLVPRTAAAKAKATARSQKQRKVIKNELVKEESSVRRPQAAASSSGAGAAAATARSAKVEKKTQHSKKKLTTRKKGSKPWLKRTIAKTGDYTSRAWLYRAVWEGRFKKTPGGLTVKDLKPNKRGRIVPKRRSEQSRKNAEKSGFAQNGRSWCRSLMKAREDLCITGFVLVKKNGNNQEASLYKRTLETWAQMRVRLTNEALEKAGSASRIVYTAGDGGVPATPPSSSAQNPQKSEVMHVAD